MLQKHLSNVKNPIVWIFVSLIISGISYELYEDYRELAFFIAALFFITILLAYNYKFTVIMIITFISGVIISYAYYNIPVRINGAVRIKQVNGYNIIASYKGRNIKLLCNENLNVGERYFIKGKIKRIHDCRYGIIGEIKPEFSKNIDDDFITFLSKIKINSFKKLENNIGRRKAGLIASVSFGYKEYLDEIDKKDMQSWGIIHTISVSGLHVVLVYSFLRRFFRRESSMAGTLIYVLFTGSVFSSIRAFIMLCSVETAKIVKRNNNSLSAIALSGIIIFLSAPYAVFQISFQLSYLATIGIILYNKKISRSLYKIPELIRNTISITLSAQIFTMPLMIMYFGTVSLNSIIGNIVIVPIMNIIVILGNIAVLTTKCGIIFKFISFIMIYIINFMDSIMTLCSNFKIIDIYCNNTFAFFYCIILISFYFAKHNYRKFIYVPLICMGIIMMQMYSPVLKFQYYNKGAVLITYKGDRILYVLKKGINIKELKYISGAYKVYTNSEKVIIKNICTIKYDNNSFVLKDKDKNYIIYNKDSIKNRISEYDIINFNDNKYNTLYVFKDEKLIMIKGYI